ncbi:MAG: DUF1697 domain-containing protein [Ignavibacteriaceae bacterium]
MFTYILLFRAINVGGKNIILMKELTELLSRIGFVNVRTYIQSGNVVLQTNIKNRKQLITEIMREMEKKYRFVPEILAFTQIELQKIISSNPFSAAPIEPKSLHIYFLFEKPVNPDLEHLKKLKSDREKFLLKDNVFYLYAPDGVGRSKLAANIEKLLGVPVTGRNLRTVYKLSELAVS